MVRWWSPRASLPNSLDLRHRGQQICLGDAEAECVSPDGSGRRVIHPNLNYPFSMVYYRNHSYYSDLEEDGVIAVNKDTSKFTDEFLPDQRSHLYGLTIATTNCLSGSHTRIDEPSAGSFGAIHILGSPPRGTREGASLYSRKRRPPSP
ncbi:unnamed protein product [Boreogadus saida]